MHQHSVWIRQIVQIGDSANIYIINSQHSNQLNHHLVLTKANEFANDAGHLKWTIIKIWREQDKKENYFVWFATSDMVCPRKETFKNSNNANATNIEETIWKSRRQNRFIFSLLFSSLRFVCSSVLSTPNKIYHLFRVLRVGRHHFQRRSVIASDIVVLLLLSSSPLLFRNRFTHACMDNGHAKATAYVSYLLRILVAQSFFRSLSVSAFLLICIPIFLGVLCRPIQKHIMRLLLLLLLLTFFVFFAIFALSCPVYSLCVSAAVASSSLRAFVVVVSVCVCFSRFSFCNQNWIWHLNVLLHIGH